MKADSGYMNGLILVFGSAIIWSFGGALARYLTIEDIWTIVFWRSVWATLFLVGFVVYQAGLGGTLVKFRYLRWPGFVVAGCFCVASISFVVALNYTTVANILFVQATVPLIATLTTWLFFGERVTKPTLAAMGIVIFGVTVMVSGSFSGQISPIGDLLSLLIAASFASATVLTRRYSEIPMVPAVILGVGLASVIALAQADRIVVPGFDLAILFLFGALNLGLGLSLFVVGARLIPAPIAALIGTTEPVFGPLWVWLVHNEVPNVRTIIGGIIVISALFLNSAYQLRRLGTGKQSPS